ncbi:MAG: AraC family transcriptional regulator [Actinomycetia bacterium]|nr:AraC family transcriptional regulator [Actinomycetes bacterium]
MTANTFHAVVTTGIYCRDDCSARPNPGNVRVYAYAAAAEADGFRACFRCRPYRSPGPEPWVEGSELVCRAVRLVLDGALDGGTEQQLAARVGVSARHLRRMFQAQVGATPDEVARSRRAHFARRLLDETDLPITTIGFAAGFSSVRQMNRVMRETFHDAPRELRARRHRHDRLVADGGLDLRLAFRPPFAWDELITFLGQRACPGVEHATADVYRRTIVLDGHPGVIELHRPEHEDHLRLRVHLGRWDGLIHVVHQARRMLDLDADPDPIGARLVSDDLLAPSVRACPGMRVPGAWDAFEVAVRVVLGQQVSVSAATTLAGRLVTRFGTPVAGLAAFGLTHTFPDAATLATVDGREIGLTNARAAALSNLAGAVADGDVVLDGARGLDETLVALQAVPGVGPWTAQCIAMRACGERDAFPAGDLGLRRGASGGGPLLSPAALDARAESWRPWRAYAAAHLWRLAGAGHRRAMRSGRHGAEEVVGVPG